MAIDRKAIIVIVAIVVVCIVAIGGFLLTNTITPNEYKSISMNGVSIEVPASDVTVYEQSPYLSIYNDTKNNIQIIVFNSENSSLDDMSDMISFASIRDSHQIGTQPLVEDGVAFNYSETLDEYSYIGNYSYTHVFITAKNKEVIKNALNTMNADPSILIENEDLNDTANKTIVNNQDNNQSITDILDTINNTTNDLINRNTSH